MGELTPELGHPHPYVASSAIGCRAPIVDLPALAPERGGSTLSGHSNCIPFARIVKRLGGFQIDASSSFD